MRVVIIGIQGAGKSTCICSLAAALSGTRWRQVVDVGFFDDGSPITISTQPVKKCGHKKNPQFAGVLLATLIDVAGIPETWNADENQEEHEKMVEALRLLFYGNIKKDVPFKEVHEFCLANPLHKIRQKYRTEYPEMKVERIVFVESANREVNRNLLKCVVKAARPQHDSPYKREVPLFGAMTKMDQVAGGENNADFQRRKQEFRLALGIPDNRFLSYSNYCETTEPGRTERLNPSRSLPILKFFCQVFDPAYTVRHKHDRLPRVWRDLKAVLPSLLTLIMAPLAVFLLTCLVWNFPLLLASRTFETNIRTECNNLMKSARPDVVTQRVLDYCREPARETRFAEATVAAVTVFMMCCVQMFLKFFGFVE